MHPIPAGAAPGPGTSTDAAVDNPHPHETSHAPHGRLAHLAFLALGVVYGDIGTSPLYAFRECFRPEYGLAPNPVNVYGVLSLIVWSLILVVTVKYIVFIMRADNRGEGGILALLALLLQTQRRKRDMRATLIALGLIGAALLYGDGVITPAISVLSAVEGLEVVTPALERVVIPITLVVLLGLFLVQRRGTAKVGTVFGPVMAIWFLVLGTLGAVEIARAPQILGAMNPVHGVQLFVAHPHMAFLLLGSVVLAVTGTEALYADMGHFGRRPIRAAWFGLVLPCLLLNYMGQGALVLSTPGAAENPFYLLAPRVLLYPLIVLATMAAIIASQALISGAFSLAQQSMLLGYTPRVTIVHTSKREVGQIFVPEVNSALMVGCLLIVLGFRSSASLSAAYGIAVTGTMMITTILFAFLARTQWHWAWWKVGLFATGFLVIDVAFFGANIIKIEHGGWVPIVIAFALFVMMTTWHRGRTLTAAILHDGQLPLPALLDDIGHRKLPRVPGTAVFMAADPEGAPLVLLHHLKHNKVLHEQVILLTMKIVGMPEYPDAERVTVTPLTHGFARVVARYGFMETPSVTHVLERSQAFGVHTKPLETTYYLGRERLLPVGRTKMARWRKKIYIFMTRNSRSASDVFGIPPNRVVELGAQIEI